MTKLLYLEDSYIKEFKAEVIEISEKNNSLVLDRTAFYPGGGGQPCDLGKIKFQNESSKIIKVKKIDGRIRHFSKDKLPAVGTEVLGQIDWARRYKFMRTHTALHALSAVVWRDYHVQVTGGSFKALTGRLDFEFEKLNSDMVVEIENKVNYETNKGLGVSWKVLPRAEAEKIPDLIRTKVNLLPPNLTEIRIVKIDGLDLQADGGTHVKNTAEIGKIKIIDYKSKGRFNKRLKIKIE